MDPATVTLIATFVTQLPPLIASGVALARALKADPATPEDVKAMLEAQWREIQAAVAMVQAMEVRPEPTE